MRKIYLFMLVFLLPAVMSFAQYAKADMSAMDKMYNPSSGSKSLNFSIKSMGFVNTPTADLKWRAIVSPVPIYHSSEQNEVVEKLKAERMEQKMASLNLKSNQSAFSPSGAVPQIGANFVGNHCNGSSPLDNSIAVSNGGIILSVTNTIIFYTNSQGQNLYYNDLISFINDPAIQGVCDPVAVYDGGADRFVFFCQVSPLNSATSKLLIFFSKTNNPIDGWYYYKLSGNPLNDASAFDYPKIAYSNNELYITGNLFFDATGKFNQAVIYQITKGPAYSGQNINFTVWYNIDGNPFTICPVSYGQAGSYGPGCYLVASSSSDDNTVKLYNLTDDLSSGNVQLKYYSINTTPYTVAPNALQMGTATKLNTNDARKLSGFYLNKMIHFVFNSMYVNNYCGINYNRLDLNSGVNTSFLAGIDGTDCTFPAVASTGLNASDKAVLIGFQESNTTSYPSIWVVNCDNSGVWSAPALVKSGEGFVYYTGDPERWGDYSGMYRKYNSSVPTVWMSGAFGGADNKWDSWIAEVIDHSNSIEPAKDDKPSVTVYPNPVVDIFSLEFSLSEAAPLTVNVIDMNGSVVKNLYDGKGYQGKNVLTFNKANLKTGVYFIVLKSNDSVLKNEKIIIN